MSRGFFNHRGRPTLVGGSLPRNNLSKLFEVLKGGARSGNRGHSGRPGHRGGSAPKGSQLYLSDTESILILADWLGIDEEAATTMLRKAFSYQDEETGYYADTNYFVYDDGGIEIQGAIRDEYGNHIGEFKRTITEDKTIRHETFEIREEAQGAGFGSRFYKNAEDAYKKAGIEQVVLTANMKVGGYSWARMGFDFADKISESNVLESFKSSYKDRYGSPLDNPPTKPYEIAAYEGPDGYRLGKDVLLGSEWNGVKNLSDYDLGYQIGKMYYASKGK